VSGAAARGIQARTDPPASRRRNPLLRLLTATDNAAMPTELPKTEPPKRKRRRFQFSLRTLLIFVLICAIPCAWLGPKIQRKAKERAAVNEIERSGGFVIYDDSDEQHPPTWLQRLLGSDAVFVYCRGVSNRTVAQLEDFDGLTSLRRLDLGYTNVTDAGLAHLNELITLEYLDLVGTPVTDAGMEHVGRLTNLKELYLMGTKITDRGLARLKRLDSLETLYLDATGVTEAGVADLRKALPRCDIQHL
jgi:Leucine Rich repeat